MQNNFLQMASFFAVLLPITILSSPSSALKTTGVNSYLKESPQITHTLLEESHKGLDLLNLATKAVAKHFTENLMFEKDVVGPSTTNEISFAVQNSYRRRLGDFDDFNELFVGTTIKLPDALNLDAGSFAGLNHYFDLTDIRCKNLAVDNIDVSHLKKNFQLIDLTVQLVGVKLECTLEISARQIGWFGWNLSAGGPGGGTTKNTNVGTIIGFYSADYNHHPPNNSLLGPCAASVDLDDFWLGGNNVFFQIANSFKWLFKSVVVSELQTVLCDEVGSLGAKSLKDALNLLNDKIEEYLVPLPPELTDPLHAEKQLTAPEDVKLMNFNDADDIIGSWFVEAVDQINIMLSSQGVDPDSPTGTGQDLGINIMMRSLLLDENREYIIPLADWPIGDSNGLVYDVHDKMTETTMYLTQAKIIGLDTMTNLNALKVEGNYTITNNLSWKELVLEIEVQLKMKASSLPDSIFESGNSKVIIENIKVRIGLDDINADFHFLLAIDKIKLGDIELSQVLNSTNMLPCLVHSIFKTEVTGLTVSTTNIHKPTLSGFISNGIDRVAKSIADAAFDMYEAVLIKAMPSFFQRWVRKMLNNALQEIQSDPKNSDCPKFSASGQINPVDFRDLLNDPDIAKEKGGAGDGRYGDIAMTLLKLVEDELLANDPESITETPILNRMVIKPFTKAQSGVEGMLRFEENIISFSENDINDTIGSAIANKVDFKVSDLRLSNLDTLHQPIKILETKLNEPMNLWNAFQLGDKNKQERRILKNSFNNETIGNKFIDGTARMMLELEGDGSPFEMKNDVDVSISVPHIGVDTALKVFMIEEDFMQLQLEHVLNLNCWLAMMPSPELDDNGLLVNSTAGLSMELEKLFMSLSDIQVHLNCIHCSTLGLNNVDEIYDTIHDSGDIIYYMKERIATFTAEILQGEWVETQISRVLFQSPKQCPSHPEYVENYEVKEYGAIPFPNLSYQSVEMVVLAGVVLGEIVSVVAAESHRNMDLQSSDPLSAQNNLNVPSDITLVDLSNLNTTLNGFVEMAITELKSSISNIVEDTEGPNASGEDLAINVQLRSLLLDDDRALSIDTDNLSFSTGGLTVGVKKIRLTGLDTFKSIDILDILASQTILNKLHLKKITIEVDMSIDLGDGSGPDTMTVTVGVTDLEMSLGVLLAIDQYALGNLELGSLLHMKNMLPCILSSMYQFEISQMSVSVGDIDIPTIDGFVSQEVKTAISLSIDKIFEKYKSVMIESVPAMFDITLRQFLNRASSNYVEHGPNKFCPLASLTSNPFVNLADLLSSETDSLRLNGLGSSPYGDFFRYLKKFIDETTAAVNEFDGSSIINEKIIRPLTNSQSSTPGSLILAGDVFGTRTNLDIGGLKGLFEFKASNARMENIDTVGHPLSLLNPIEQHVLNNTVTFGVGSRYLRASVSLAIAFEDDRHSLRNEFDLSLDIMSAQVVLAALLKISEISFLKFPMRDLFNINCWLSTMPAPQLDAQGIRLSDSDLNAALKNLQIIMSEIRLHMKCTSCSSPEMEALSSHLSSPEAIASVTDLTNNLFEYMTSLLGGDFLQTEIDRALNEAPLKCPHNPKYNPSVSSVQYLPFSAPQKTKDPITFLLIIAAVCSGLIFFTVVMNVSVSRIRRKRHARWMQTLSTNEMYEISVQQSMEKEREDRLNDISSCMIHSPSIPLLVRYIMPFVLLGNVGLFLSGHLSLGASVNIRANVAGEVITIDKFFEFSMAKSTMDMWDAGAKILAVLIVVFSGAWPYTKQLVTLFLWIVPPKYVSVSRRGSIFLWLDKLAKWSFVDIFVLLMSVAAFNITVNSPANLAFLTPNLYSLKLMVIPLWGMYANMMAQLISQISSHFIVHYHRKIIADALGEAYGGGRLGIDSRDDVEDDVETDGNEDKFVQSPKGVGRKGIPYQFGALCDHRFDRDGVKKGNNLYVHKFVNYVLVGFALIFVAFVVWGCVSTSFSLEVLGIFGLLVESGQEFNEAVFNYSVFDIVNLLSDQSKLLGKAGETVGLGVLSAVLVISVFIVPIVQMVLLLHRWFMPLSKKSQTQSFVLLEILDAWQYIEVYILSVVVAAWQLGGVSEFMINSFCDPLQDTFSTLTYYGIISDDDAQCFRVNARVEYSLWVLLTAAIILALINHFISKAASQQERDQNIKAEEDFRNKRDYKSRHLYCPSDDGSDDHSFQGDYNYDKKRNELVSLIKPVPHLFTDYYRWFLYKSEIPPSPLLQVGMGIPIDENSIFSSSSSLDHPDTVGVSIYTHKSDSP